MFRTGGASPGPGNNVSITGGSITGVTGVPYTLMQSGIPLIGLSSGSVASNGAISGITALTVIYPHAYCYFPANALATAIAAGWYYCTFSGTTAGVAFLNSWDPTTGIAPTIPNSPTAVTDGKGSFTGVTSEQGVIVNIPANAMGANGQLTIWARTVYTNSAGTKTIRSRMSGASGTIFLSTVPTSTACLELTTIIVNDGTTGNQSGTGNILLVPATLAVPGVSILGTNDTTTALDTRITIQRNTATDNAIIERFRVQLSSAP